MIHFKQTTVEKLCGLRGGSSENELPEGDTGGSIRNREMIRHKQTGGYRQSHA
jgi:hypothetical protein